ncbi:hypothetical protein CP8484711_2004, partial [Chlamydia psittaci 84-8471/1]
KKKIENEEKRKNKKEGFYKRISDALERIYKTLYCYFLVATYRLNQKHKYKIVSC